MSSHGTVIPLPCQEIESIQEWAAREAALILVDCWEDAIELGKRPEDLIKDVNEVCEILQLWAQKAFIAMKVLEAERESLAEDGD